MSGLEMTVWLVRLQLIVTYTLSSDSTQLTKKKEVLRDKTTLQ